MTTSDDLFQLIKALTKSEKRYFKLSSSLHKGEKVYLKLFDAIEKQTRIGKYNEESIVVKLKQGGIETQFWVLKNYLYNQILYALESYHASIHSEVKGLLRHTEILYEKGLYKQALKAMKKAKHIAVKNEMHSYLLETYRYWELPLAKKSSDFDRVKQVIQDESHVLSLIQNTHIYCDLYSTVFAYYFKYGIPRDIKHLQAIEKVMQNPYLSDESKAKTFEARLYFYDTHGIAAVIKGHSMGFYRYSRKIVQDYHAHPEMIKQKFNSYLSNLSNVIFACKKIKRYNEVSGYLQKMESLSSIAKSTVQTVRLFWTISLNWLDLFIITGQFNSAVEYFTKIKKQLHEFEKKLNEIEKIELFSNIALSYFGTGEYRKSIFWLNRIRNEISLTIRLDIESFFRLFYLIIHYELGNNELLTYIIQSTYRFLKKKERLLKFETFVMDFLRKLPSSKTPEQLHNAFKKLHSQLKPLTKDPYEKNAFEYFDYISWLKSKIENRPFAEIVREKARKFNKE